jgi:predicted nucleotidyltransferase
MVKQEEYLMYNENEIQTVTRRVIDEILNLFDVKVYKIILYGSYARGDFTPESDVDIMILLNCDKKEVISYRNKVSILSSRLCLENDIEISILLRDRESYERAVDILPFYRNIAKEGVVMYG